MTAKETLENIAKALGVVSSESNASDDSVTQKNDEVPADVKPASTQNDVSEVEKVEEVAQPQEVVETADATDNVPNEQEKNEEISDDEKTSISESENNRIKELESTIDSLKEMLAQGLLNDKPKVETPVQKVVEEPVKPLTHSPESPVERKHTTLGNKGENIMSRVYKYMNR